MTKQLKNVKHDYIRYANCWEDADLLLEGLAPEQGARILSIGSAGDNSFSLLANKPDLVVAVDINPVQLKLIRFKKEAISQLDLGQYLELLGFCESDRRRDLVDAVLQGLSNDDRCYWNQHAKTILGGIIYQGKFEKYFKLFRTRILPLIHSKKRVSEILREKSGLEQRTFYNSDWANRRWNMLFQLFFSEVVLGRFGRDPAFLKEVDVPVAKSLFDRSAKHLSTACCQHNYFLSFILTGSFGDNLQHYLRAENYYAIKENIDCLEIFEGLAEEAFERYDQFGYFNLSNIFEYMQPETFRSVTRNFARNSRPGAKFAYWNLMVPRRMSKELPDLFTYDEDLSHNLCKKDKGFFYNSIIIDQRK